MKQKQSLGTNTPATSYSGNDGSDIVRPSVSMKKRHWNLLEEMANEAHAGNRSACLRAAIEEYARTLEGEDELAVKKLESAVRELGVRIAEIKEYLAEDSSEDPSPDDAEAVSQQRSAGSASHRQTYETISAQGPISLEEITSQTDASLVDVADTLQALRKRGLITKCSRSGQMKYELNDSEVVNHE